MANAIAHKHTHLVGLFQTSGQRIASACKQVFGVASMFGCLHFILPVGCGRGQLVGQLVYFACLQLFVGRWAVVDTLQQLIAQHRQLCAHKLQLLGRVKGRWQPHCGQIGQLLLQCSHLLLRLLHMLLRLVECLLVLGQLDCERACHIRLE